MYPFRHPTPVEPTTSYTIGVALRHNTRLKRDNNKLNEQLEELIDSVYEVYPEGFSSMPERLENIMTKILIRREEGEHEWQLKEL